MLRKINLRKILIGMFAFSILLSGCTNTPGEVQLRESEVAFAEMLNQTSTALAMPPTEIPTEVIPPTEVMEPTVRVLPTQLRYPQATATAQPTVAQAIKPGVASGNKAQLVTMVPGNNQTARVSQSFTLTFTLKNDGTTVWTNAFKAVHTGGTKMSATDSAPMSGNVASGASGTITFHMVAPKDKGTYTQNFNFIDPWNAVILPLTFTVVVGDSGTIPQSGTITPSITVTRTGTPMGHFEYMCSDPARSIQQGQGCDTFCQVTFPQRLNCYVMGVLNPTATSTPNTIVTQAFEATQAAATLQAQQQSIAQTQQAVYQTETALAQPPATETPIPAPTDTPIPAPTDTPSIPPTDTPSIPPTEDPGNNQNPNPDDGGIINEG